MKMRYFDMGDSDMHLTDSAIVLQRLGERVDRDYISSKAAEFGLSAIWQAVLQRVE